MNLAADPRDFGTPGNYSMLWVYLNGNGRNPEPRSPAHLDPNSPYRPLVTCHLPLTTAPRPQLLAGCWWGR